ncbi:magnesium/cobalt transporter CorA [Gammaproteobacteria bacterium LSUCC0112]|nr:magnesium/cobalt transporter CorA [Gammaproteobacteria bacterium LSUCC0112]
MTNTHASHRQSRLIKKRGKKTGAAPGTLVHIGDISNLITDIHYIRYDEHAVHEQEITDVSECAHEKQAHQTGWINIDGLQNPDIIRSIGERFSIHPLVQEDILNTDHRPKIEVHDDYLYIVIKVLSFNESTQSLHNEQVSLIVGDNYLLSFCEQPGTVFDGVRNRLRTGRKIRELGPDYLAYALIDAVVDNYFLLLEKFGDVIEDLEDELMQTPGARTLNRVQHFKREMLLLRKAIWPMREVLSSLSRDESVILSSDIRLYLRDVYDHSIHIIDNMETLRELLAGMLDLYVSSSSQRLNETMKTLTLFASIFMPLTFIAGVYGMNFEFMPELHWRWGYPLIMLIMAGTGAGLLYYFRRRHWL